MSQVMAVSTDYRDSRKGAYQEYAIVLEHNACRLPSILTPTRAAPLGVAYVAAAISLGLCLGVDFSRVEGKARGPDLLKTVRRLDPGTFPKDIKSECLEGIDLDERPNKGDWIVIWGGKAPVALTRYLKRPNSDRG
jgi:NADPH:quinone reductase-like Zn-dependent oxidoreductase